MLSFGAEDHAFADGLSFGKPLSFIGAWRTTRHVGKARLLQHVWRQFDRGGEIGENVQLSCSARLVNRNKQNAIEIGAHSVVRGIIRAETAGRIELGAFVYVGDGSILSAAEQIVVGEGTLIAHNVQIFDNDTHPVDADQRLADFKKKLGIRSSIPIEIAHAPVKIGQKCWIGMSSVVMKGVTIGDRTIVASGSVVVHDLPPDVIAAGNPAKPIKTIGREV